MTKEDIKQIVREMVEARIYGDPYRTSDEYDLTPEELNTIKNMSHKQRMTFAAKKIKQARRAKGQCISGGPNCEPPPKNTDGTPGTYCQKHLEQFRVARAKLTKARGSCARCPSTDVVPGNKLCQNCIDALNKPRDKAVETGLCMRCKKIPATPPTKFCTACMAAKVERNKQIKMRRKGWQDYARDIQAAALAQRVKNLGIQETDEEKPKSVWAPGTGGGTKHAGFTSKSLGRRYRINQLTGAKIIGRPPGGEYTLTPQEVELMNKMTDSEKSLFRHQKIKQARKDRGVCYKCGGRINVENSKLCSDCIQKRSNERKKDRTNRINSGLCTICNNPAVQNPDGTFKTYCPKHLEYMINKNMEYYKKKQSSGKCVQCGQPAIQNPDGTFQIHCEKCVERQRKASTQSYINRGRPNRRWTGYEIEESK